MRTIILLSVVALALASPIEDQKKLDNNPDISKLPLKKDEKVDPVKVVPAHHTDGSVSYPLHKREAPNTPLAAAKPDVTATGAKPQVIATNPQNNSPVIPPRNNQQPIYNQQRPAAGSNTQKVQPQPQRNTNNQRPQQPLNGQRTQPNSQQPSNGQRIQPNSQQPAVNSYNQKTQPIPNAQSSSSNQPAQPAQAVRARREAPKATDVKTPAKAPATLQNKPVVPQSSQIQQQPKRPVRETPKATDIKSTPQVPSTQQKTEVKPAANTHQKTQQPIQGVKPSTDPKTTSQATSGQKPQASPAQIARVPLSSSSARVRRDAPNPHEQSKIVPSAHQLSPSKADTPHQAAVDTKSSNVAPKRDSPLKDSSSPSSSYSNDSHSPTFVHPVPVNQILKKPGNDGNDHPSVTVTKTDSVKITPALPTSEKKQEDHKAEQKPAVVDQKSPSKP